MSNAKHTPIPWRIERQSNGLHAVCADLAKRHGGSTPFSLATDIRVANAEFIVRACNSHADLLEACKRVVSELDGDPHRAGLVAYIAKQVAKTEVRE